MRHLLGACAAIALASGAVPAGAAVKAVATTAPSGTYTLDHAHADLTFRVVHMGFSHYTARFGKFDAKLQLDTAHPENSSVTATIDPASLELNNPPEGFHAELIGPHWLDSGKFPQMTFKSTKVEMTGPDTAKITGAFSLHWITQPVVLEAKFNGGYPGFSMDPHGRVGFSAHGELQRSAFGIAYGIPAKGSNLGVSDAVEIRIEAEFTGPPLKQ